MFDTRRGKGFLGFCFAVKAYPSLLDTSSALASNEFQRVHNSVQVKIVAKMILARMEVLETVTRKKVCPFGKQQSPYSSGQSWYRPINPLTLRERKIAHHDRGRNRLPQQESIDERRQGCLLV